jgi:glycosyltransferase involved in cell wall biosynthesis
MSDTKKSIWYISKYAAPLKYGFGSRHFYLSSEFRKLGHSIVVISSNANHLAQIPDFEKVYTKEVIDGVETWWIKTIRYKGANSFRRILSWIDFELKLLLMPVKNLPKPDAIICSSLSLFTILNGYIFKKRFKCKLVFEVRDIWPLTIVEEGGFKSWNPFVMFLAWVEKFGYRTADLIVGTMPNLAEHVKNVCGRELNCRCVPFGYDPALYDVQESLPEGYEKTYIPQDKFIVGYAGSIGVTNALEPLLQCATEMKDNPRVHFLLLGDGDLLAQYKARVADLKNITFVPKVKKTQVQKFLHHCHVLYFSVHDSKVWLYGLSLNKLIDYMLSAKPIIASYSGYPSMINEAQCGTFVPAKNVAALKRVISEYADMPEDALNQIGQRGRDWLLENRPYEKIARAYCRLF